MKYRLTLLALLSVLALLFFLGRYRIARGQEALFQGHSPQSALGTAFTYQGRLKDGSGNPINDTCDFEFSLWDEASAGSQIGGDSAVTGVVVADGHFAV